MMVLSSGFAPTMATYNKYLVYGEFSLELFSQVALAVCQKAPVAVILEVCFVQIFLLGSVNRTLFQLLFSSGHTAKTV